MENLEVIINLPNLKFNIPEDSINFHTLERIIFNLSRKIGQELLEELLPLIDDKLKKERKRGELSNQGKRLRYMTTLLGDITFYKRLYRERSGKWKYLLDEKLGIKKNQRISELGEKAEGYLAFISGSYRNSEDLMQRFYGDSRSFESIRGGVIRQGKKILKEEKEEIDQERIKALKQTEGELTKEADSGIIYLEVDGTNIHLQQEEKTKAELKLGIISKGKERRYQTGLGEAKKLQDKFTYTGIVSGDEFMSNLAILGEKRFQLSQAELVLIGGDGASWIKEGAKNYFPGSIYQLCKFHLERKLKQTLPYHKERQKEIRNLLKKGEIDKTLKELCQEKSLKPEHQKDLEGLMHYIYSNQEGINAVDRLRDQGFPVEDLGAIEGNIDKTLANRFKKRGMRWSIPGALSLAKVGEKIVNNEWDSWWPKEADPIELKSELEKVVSLDFNKGSNDKYDNTYSLPVLSGPHQDRPWVRSLKRLVSIN
ncbi:MAG: ISLre2 family transposase [Candidatus Atribacteria bacterium]|nr:ISLre2 family transposase [Candidatus Atribacteria bacterium]